MNFVIKCLISFFVAYILSFLFYVIFVNRKRKEYTECKKQMEIQYIVKKFDLDMRKTKYKTVKWLVTYLNCFIISFTFTIIANLNIKYVFKLVLAFVLLMILIYSLYEIAGRILKKKENTD